MGIKSICLTVATVAVTFSAHGVSLSGQAEVDVRVRMPATVRAYEPIEVRFSITNSAADALDANLGWNRIGAFSFRITRPSGSTFIARPVSPVMGGISASSQFAIASGSVYSGSILLNEWADLSEVGLYQVTVTSDATFKNVRSGSVVTANREWATTVMVGAASDADVKAVCDRLASKVLEAGKTPFEEARQTAVALASVRHDEAIPYLEAVARQGRFAWIAVPAIGRRPGSTATAALTSLASTSGDGAELAISELKRRAVVVK